MNSVSGMTAPAPLLDKPSRRNATRVQGSSAHRVLLGCGILSSLVYAVADIIGGLQYEGYSFASQAVSELSAVGAPSRPFMVVMLTAYSILIIAFGVGVWKSAVENRSLRLVGGLTIGFGLVCLMGPLTPMHQREVIAAGGGTISDMMHIVFTVVDVLFIMLIIGFASGVFGRRFRMYSIVTIVAMIVFGALTGSASSNLEADLPTPWAGVTERINIYGFLLWFAVFATLLLRASSASPNKTD